MQKHPFLYAQEVERTLYESSSAWEGIEPFTGKTNQQAT
jgi:hypothetical protein